MTGADALHEFYKRKLALLSEKYRVLENEFIKLQARCKLLTEQVTERRQRDRRGLLDRRKTIN